MIGTGGRGTGAIANVLMSAEGVEITALGDLNPDRIEQSRITLDKQAAEDRDFGARYKTGFKVTGDKVYTGFDAYQKVLASNVDMVILSTPPGFRPHASRRRRGRRQAHLHGEAGGDRFGRHPLGARDLRRGAQEEAGHRRRHPAPSPGRVPRDDQAHPQRRHRRRRRAARSSGTRAGCGTTAGSRTGPTPNGRFATGCTSPGCRATTSSSSTSTTSTSRTG